MINPIELRIGNLVNFIPDGVDFSINEINYFKEPFTINGLDPENINPIFITEEWLIKLGFNYDYDRNLRKDLPARMELWFYKGNCAEMDLRQDGKFISFKCGHIKYIHQLQNLFYSLTGEDLKLNE